MTKDTLLEVNRLKFEVLTTSEIEAMMDEELSKAPNEMDTELIKLCLEALNSEAVEEESTKRIKMPMLKIVAIVAIVAVVFAISVTAGAKFFHINAPSGTVKINGDHFSVNLNNEGIVDDILGQLKEDGIEDPLLPEMLIYLETEISDYQVESIDGHNMVVFDFNFDDIKGRVTIQNYHSEYEFQDIQNEMPSEVDNYEILTINGNQILVFGNNVTTNIQYTVNNNEYIFAIYCDFETALKIAKTI